MKITLLLLTFLSAEAAFACEVPIAAVAQEQVRRARDVAEVVARTEPDTYDVMRVWKGTLPSTVVLPSVIALDCGVVAPFVPGSSYVVLLHEHGRAEVISAEAAAPILRYLAAPRSVSTRDLVGMLRGWNGGSITSEAMARWLREVLPVADVDDWAVLDGLEVSLVLRSMLELDEWINPKTVPLAELTCELEVLRTRGAPELIRVLLHPPRTLEEIAAFEAQYQELEDLQDERCGGSSREAPSVVYTPIPPGSPR